MKLKEIFNIFADYNSSVKPTTTIKEEVVSVKEIHDKLDWFSTLENLADDNRINVLNEEISKKQASIESIEKRFQLGFALPQKEKEIQDNTKKQINVLKEELNDLYEESSLREKIQKLRFSYPHLKFILRKDAEEICEKYNLTLSYSNFYIGEIPEKNLKEIESFVFPKESLFFQTQNKLLWVGDERIPIHERDRFQNSKFFVPIEEPYITRGLIENDYNKSWEKIFEIEKNTHRSTHFKKIFIMIAPSKDFLYTKQDLDKAIPPDPIVLYPVQDKDIFVIVSKWGEESSDERLVNPNNN